MKQKRVIIDRNSRVRRQRDPIPWRYCVLTVVCGLLLVSGFFLAAKQHFSAVQAGMSNADLRTRIAKLRDENRKLLLSKERASTPVKIAKLATAYGFTDSPRIVFDDSPTVKDDVRNPNPQPVVAISAEKPLTIPPVVKARDVKTAITTAIKTVQSKSTKKESVSDDQIAALRTSDE